MTIASLNTPDLVALDISAKTPEDAIRIAADLLMSAGRLADPEVYVREVLKRESETSTSVGFGFATPHARSNAVLQPSVVVLRSAEVIRWHGGDLVDMIVQLAMPDSPDGKEHLRVLANLARRLIHQEFREQLRSATSTREVSNLLNGIGALQ